MGLNKNTSGMLFALCSYALFVIGDSFYKYLGSTYTVYQMAFYGKLFASIFLIAVIAINRKKIRTYFPKLQFLRSLALTVTSLCIYYAYKYMTLAEVALLFYMCPFIIAILTHYMLKEKVGIHRIASILVGFVGVLIIIQPGAIEFNTALIAMFVAVFCYSLAGILSRMIGPTEPNINFALFPSILTFIVAIPFLPSKDIMIPLADIGLMGIGGTIGAIAIMLIAMAFIRTHAVTISILAYTDMIWAMLLGYLIFNDVTTNIYLYFGGLLIIASGVYMIYRENKLAKKS